MSRWRHDAISAGKDIAIVFWYEMRCNQFLRNFFRNSKFWNWNSDLSTFQQRNSKIKFRPESPESKTESEIRFQWGSQKPEPKIRIPNQDLLSYLASPMSSNQNSSIKMDVTITYDEVTALVGVNIPSLELCPNSKQI
jgi:hypothetical protein